MQLKLVFDKEVSLPLHYRHIISGTIYHLLEISPEYAKNLHEKQGFKGFAFGPVRGSYALNDNGFQFASDASLEIRSIDHILIENIQCQLIKQPELNFGQHSVPIREWIVSHFTVDKAEADIVTQSPIVAYRTLEDGHTLFFSPKGEEYYSILYANAEKKWKALGDGSEFSFQIKAPPEGKFRKIFDIFHKTYITAYHGAYHLSGAPKVLDLLYQTGIGSKNSEGFGMFDIPLLKPEAKNDLR